MFTEDEQKITTLHLELCGIISALQTYEHSIIGSPRPIKIYCDHKLLLHLWARKRRLSHRFFQYQVIITPKFTNLQIIWTPGKNLAFPLSVEKKKFLEGPERSPIGSKGNSEVYQILPPKRT